MSEMRMRAALNFRTLASLALSDSKLMAPGMWPDL